MYETSISEANEDGVFEWPKEDDLLDIMTNAQVSLKTLNLWSKAKTNEILHSLKATLTNGIQSPLIKSNND